MTASPAPDVDRVLDRMGRSTIGYRSFAHTVETSADAAPGADAAGKPNAAAPAVLFGLVGDALPTASTVDAVVPAVAPVSPFIPPTMAPTPPAPQGSPVRLASLTDMFRALSGDGARTPLRRDSVGQDTVFPFRRR